MWNYYDDNGNKQARIIFKNEKVYKYVLWDEAGNVKDEPLIIERKPQYRGGEDALVRKVKRELGHKLKYLKGISKIWIGIRINEEGKVDDVKIVKPLPPRYQKLIENFFYKLTWKPAIQLNRNISIRYTMPITLN